MTTPQETRFFRLARAEDALTEQQMEECESRREADGGRDLRVTPWESAAQMGMLEDSVAEKLADLGLARCLDEGTSALTATRIEPAPPPGTRVALRAGRVLRAVPASGAVALRTSPATTRCPRQDRRPVLAPGAGLPVYGP